MTSFEDLYCQAERCTPEEFRRKIFWRCLTWRAKLVAPFLGGWRGAHFRPDLTFLTGVGRATTMAQIRTEIRDYFEDQSNRGWLRQVADIRVSTRRVRSLARRYLPESTPASAEATVNEGVATTMVMDRPKAS